MIDVKYDQIGKTYNSTRMADQRITNQIMRHLGLPRGSRIVDVGAGTGNYSYELAVHGFTIIAVEPSITMRTQGKQHDNITWVEGIAEQLPIADHSVDGVICTLATHHFTDLGRSFREMSRITNDRGNIVIFTADPRVTFGNCWISDYFEDIVAQSCHSQPDQESFRDIFRANTGRDATIFPFPLPFDLQDKFFFSGWRTPELFLEEHFRNGISSLAAAPTDLLENNLQRLSEDLKNNKWREKYGEILNQVECDCGYFFLVG